MDTSIPAQADGIELIVGLPHLNEGPLLQRARSLAVPVLLSANSLSRWSRARGWPEWLGWRLSALQRDHGLRSIDLDSGGFVAMVRYRGIPWSVDAYLDLAASYPFRRFASLDYCTEQGVAGDRQEVLDRISRTIRVNRDCRRGAEERGIAERLMPVIQGRLPADYERCIDAFCHNLPAGTVVGVGSMCRREVGGPEGAVSVFEHLDRVMPAGVRLHGFGIKGSALPYLAPFADRIASVDSQAYGIAARRKALKQGVTKSDRFVADEMERWVGRQRDRLAEPARRLGAAPASVALEPREIDPWESAIADARAEIRDLIERGELDHNEIADAWVEQWAADIYQSRRRQLSARSRALPV